MKWNKIKDGLPDIDEYVLWMYESGGMIYECIDKDWAENNILDFINGNFVTGPITHWWHSVYSHEKDPDRANLEWLVSLALDEAIISISRGRELLGFQSMEQMRDWFNKQEPKT